ncbi:MAG: U32 family peptidase [Candidatus Caccovivens sp.]
MNKKVELLAPAGSVESLIVAINHGADAVYLGMQSFNARNKAENFNEQNIREYVKFAHLYGVKVYLTINTLVRNDELKDLVDLVKIAVSAKVDAYLVQDLGVAKLLKETFPNIVLHASTQMGIHNLEGALVAKDMGFSRIVLARETTMEDIKKIHENCDIEMEYFVQGALCVAFSGNCYLSSLGFGESGNRGRCLQLCRLPYTASSSNQNLKNGYLLSPNDLCHISRLKELIDSGICSFKIEGRMRRPAYVAQAVQSYRNAIDNINANLNQEKHKLSKVFSRGKYNEGYYLDNVISKNIINPDFQNHRGIKIGKIIKVVPFKQLHKITVQTDGTPIRSGDGLKFIKDGKENSMGVGNVNNVSKNIFEVFSKIPANVGSEVYLTLDSENEKKLTSLQKKLKIKAVFVAKIGDFATLSMKFGEIEAQFSSSQILQQAKNAPISKEDIFKNINKLNDTHFEISHFDCEFDNVFIAKSVINEMRRKCVELLEEKIIEKYEKNLPNIKFVAKNYNFCEKIFKNHEKYYIVDENQKYEIPNNSNVVLSPNNFNIATINKLKQQYSTHKIFVMLPMIKRGQDSKVVDEIISHLNTQTDGLVINNIYGLYYLKKGFKIVANYPINATNSLTLQVLKEIGVVDAVISIENLSENLNDGLDFSGRPALMTFTHCPYKTTYEYDDCKNCKFDGKLSLAAQDGQKFTLRRTKIANCYFELLSPSKLTQQNATMIDLRNN